MGVHDHEHDAAATRVSVHVVVVSTSRNAETDETGPRVVASVEGAGHAVTGREVVTDDVRAIGAALDRLLGRADVRCVLLCGGTGFSGRDVTAEVVKSRLDREMPGFGELFRSLSFAEVGPAAMLSRALGGVARGKAVFALPGSPAACDLALQRLILPNLRHLAHQVEKEEPVVAPAAPPESAEEPAGGERERGRGPPLAEKEVADSVSAPPGLSVTELKPEGGRESGPERATGWEAALRAMGATLSPGTWTEVPESLERVAPAKDVLESAGERAQVKLKDGRAAGAFGFPDLRRGSSKVLLVAGGDPYSEIVALHRHPAVVGLASDGGGLLPGTGTALGPLCQKLGHRPMPGDDGSLFALDGGAICALRANKVVRWDGKKEQDLGRPAQALASLLLQWSQR